MTSSLPANELADPSVAPSGHRQIAWARRNMPILRLLEQELRASQPLRDQRVALSIHLEAKTAYLALVLRAAGAQVAVTGSNSGSTKDDVVAALAEEGLHVYARHGASDAEMTEALHKSLQIEPTLVVDDGGDLTEALHTDALDRAGSMLGACEETTTGVVRARARDEAGALSFPVLLINEARCKYLFDNVHGTGQSVWDAVMRTTNQVIAGKSVVVVGFGWCGAGCALRAQGLGAKVTVCEVDPVKAADAAMRGHAVAPLLEACAEADIVLTVTGVRHTLRPEHFERMRDGTLVANAGHFQHEIDVDGLAQEAREAAQPRHNVSAYRLDDRWIHLLGNGNIVNIACGDGHPAEIMDTSFALQALAVQHLVAHAGELEARAMPVPEALDRRVAELKLDALGLRIDTLRPDQESYLRGQRDA